jgi:transposase-like protein
MEKIESKCPKCGAENNQIKKGHTKAGSQRMYCKGCGCKYTPNPKNRAYSEEVRKQAIRLLTLGNTGRGVGKALNMSKANAYRWAREEAKKNGGSVDKP